MKQSIHNINMARSWQLVFSVFIISFSLCCAIYPQQKHRMKKQLTGVSTQTHPTLGDELALLKSKEILDQGRVKRKAVDCSVSETKDGKGFQKIIDANAVTTFNFFIQPQPGFTSLVFRAKLNNKLTPGPWQYFKESLVVNRSQLEIDWTHPTWIPVETEYFKKDIRFAPDKHALRVKVGRVVNEELITRWWRTHSYEGFTVEAEGPLKVLRNCNPGSTMPAKIVTTGELRGPILIACVLGGSFLLVLSIATVYLLITRRSHSAQHHQNNLPHVPTSLIRGRKQSDSDHIYESMDEGILAKLRQNFNADALAADRTECVKNHNRGSAKFYENTKTISTVRMPHHTSGIPSAYARDTMAFSLLEEKEALREGAHGGLDSPVESHYVDMHGIVSRTSSLSK